MNGKVFLSKFFIDVSRFTGYMYTSKLVKTFIIKSFKDLGDNFKPSKGSKPKLVHISPLYVVTNRGTRCVYSFIDCKPRGGIVKCQGAPKPVVLDGDYYFYFGFHTNVLTPSRLLNGLVENNHHCTEFMSQNICIRFNSVDVLDAHIIGFETAREVLKTGFLKVIFSSPAFLRDPLRPYGRYKSFLPTPYTVFATPVYIILYTRGIYSVKKLRTALLRLHRLFNETYSVLGGIRVKWIHYGKKPEPALIGFVNYKVNYEYLEFLRQKINVEEWLGEIFAYTLALGVGTGRATGFGHVELKPFRSQGMDS